MTYNFSDFTKRLKDIEDWLKKEFSSIRTGRATITLLDGVVVDSYGTKISLVQCANISIEDPKTIKITPWDKGIIKSIEKAIREADLGISIAVDSESIRVIFPDLTTETRERLVKQSKIKIEEARVSVRNERSKVSNDIESQKKDGKISEDNAKRDKESMQKFVDEATKKFDEMGKKKEQEIMS